MAEDEENTALEVKIYDDVAAPAAKEIGKTGGGLTRLFLRPAQLLANVGNAWFDGLAGC